MTSWSRAEGKETIATSESSAIFDASVVIRWMVDDPLTAPALKIAEARSAEAPHLLCSEVANGLRNYHRAGLHEMEWCQNQLRLLPRLVRLHDERPLLPLAFRLAAERDHAVYDCVYVAMAVDLALPLITADRKMARKFAGLEGLDLIDLNEAEAG